MEEKVIFRSDDLKIEGLFEGGRQDRGVVVTHPHPLYGGDMHNPVVSAICEAYRRKGHATLRFNFRGVGGSQGRHDHGRGEQTDLRAALAFLATEGIGKIELAGYSFGAWINSLAVQDEAPVRHLVMVSPPVDFLDFSPVGALPGLRLVVTGSRDDIAPVEAIRPLLSGWNPTAAFEIIAGADHFYGRHLRLLKDSLSRFI